MLKYLHKYETININDTILIPTIKSRGPDFEERLREAFDVDEMIE